MTASFSTLTRTPAYRNFRNKLGYPNFNLNTIVIGLEGVKRGIVHKPDDLAVTWNDKNPASAAMQARSFATKSMLVFASDAIDHFMRDLAESRELTGNSDLASWLRGEPQIEKDNRKHQISERTIRNLIERLSLNESDRAEACNTVEKFYKEFLSVKRRRPRIEERFDKLAAAFPCVPPHYVAALHLLVSWRNHHVHGDYSEVIDREVANKLRNASEVFKEHHSGTDIVRALENYYDARGAPSLKELSTLISVAHRVAKALDQAVRDRVDVERYATECLSMILKGLEARGALANIWRRRRTTRQRKLQSFLIKYGFTQTTEPDVKFSLPSTFWEALTSKTYQDVVPSAIGG